MAGSTPGARWGASTTAWRMLTLGVGAQAGGTFLISTPAYLIPLLHTQHGLPLAAAGLIASTPMIGKVLTLVAWGALADRIGERWVIATGLGLSALFAGAAAASGGYAWLSLFLVLAGAASASTDAASGRVVIGWFPRHHRGLAMGVRQMAQPIGVATAALAVPPLAERYETSGPLIVGGALTLLFAIACAAGLRDAPRSPATADLPTAAHRPANPYRRDSFLARIHSVSALLVIPQLTLSTFGLVWLTVGLGWAGTVAGVVVAASQFIGAGGRILVGALSDRLGTRVGVMRWIVAADGAAMLLLALTGLVGWGPAVAVSLAIASTVSVANNGLAFASVAEAAGPSWSGKALGVQNTGQFLASSAVGPAVGALIGVVGYPLAFAIVAAAPLASWRLIPRRDRQWDEPDGR